MAMIDKGEGMWMWMWMCEDDEEVRKCQEIVGHDRIENDELSTER